VKKGYIYLIFFFLASGVVLALYLSFISVKSKKLPSISTTDIVFSSDNTTNISKEISQSWVMHTNIKEQQSYQYAKTEIELYLNK
jgi:hypothetical protein